MIVVDTNVVAYFFLMGPSQSEARTLRQHEPDWIVPAIWRSEFRNVMAGQMRCKGLSLSEAITIQGLAEELLEGAEFMVNSTAVLELVDSSKCSSCNCDLWAWRGQKEFCSLLRTSRS